MLFKREFLQNIANEDWNQNEYNIEIVKDEICSTSRWSNLFKLIFKLDNKYYRTWYERGATDEGPWEYAKDEIEVDEVVQYIEQVIDYKKKEGIDNNE